MAHFTRLNLALVIFAAFAPHANAGVLTLTAAGTAEGLSLSTFASGYPTVSGIGPISFAIDPVSGRAVTTSYGSGRVISYASDTDGQTYSGGTQSTQVYGAPTGLTTLGGKLYVADQGSGVSRIDGFGNVVGGTFFAAPGATGLAASVATGLLYTSDNAGLQSINPVTSAIATLATGAFDGLTTTNDGTQLYAEFNQHVLGYRLSDMTQIFDSGFISGADGALIANLAGVAVLLVNTNNGELWQVNLSDATQILVASGGSRGDIVALDPTNNTALLTQSDTIMRLSLPAGSTFGVTSVPEPASLGLFSLALLGVALLGRARLRRRA